MGASLAGSARRLIGQRPRTRIIAHSEAIGIGHVQSRIVTREPAILAFKTMPVVAARDLPGWTVSKSKPMQLGTDPRSGIAVISVKTLVGDHRAGLAALGQFERYCRSIKSARATTPPGLREPVRNSKQLSRIFLWKNEAEILEFRCCTRLAVLRNLLAHSYQIMRAIVLVCGKFLVGPYCNAALRLWHDFEAIVERTKARFDIYTQAISSLRASLVVGFRPEKAIFATGFNERALEHNVIGKVTTSAITA